MTQTFKEKIRSSIEDATLQAALDANAERRRKVRLEAMASVPDWDARRQRAHAVRADVIENLDRYVGQFSARLARNGCIVHRAADAAEANRIVLELAARLQRERASTQGLLVAKSKSMVSEEIRLNHALEAAGHRVVETDLGEYIIQLRGERPAHIITPAVHLNRRQVGELFHQKLGIPYTESIPVLTNTARAVLREVFLTADIGLTGVNFGVVENGALTIVTNEGNGRMCATMPRLHIALMGIERILPTLDDLAMFLSLLPRSATGQKLSVYTQLLRAPRPGQERHVIIVDNGRLRLRNSPLRESLYCIRCGACLNACPVFRELGGHAYLGMDGSIAPYPGPIGSVVSPGLLGENYVQLAQASTLCGACKDACPVDIDLPRLLTRVRAGGSEKPLPTINQQSNGKALPVVLRAGLQGYTLLTNHPKLFAASQVLAGIGSRLLSPFSTWMRTPSVTGWGYSKDLPRPALKSFRARWNSGRQKSDSQSAFTQTRLSSQPTTGHPGELPVNLPEQFKRELNALGGTVIPCSEKGLRVRLANFLYERQVKEMFLYGVGVEHLPPEIIPISQPDPEVRVGLTGAAAGIANTGTVLLLDEGETLKASLLPETHLVVLPLSLLVADLPEALQKTRRAANAVLVTGPSRTADIEMTLTIGVHGPKELVVFLVDDSQTG
jgi:L-lactate dehydrogenase complex protein LldF